MAQVSVASPEKLFQTVAHYNLQSFQRMLTVAGGDDHSRLERLAAARMPVDFEWSGIQARGMSLYAYIEALVAAGHERQEFLAVLPQPPSTSRAPLPSLGAKGKAAPPPPPPPPGASGPGVQVATSKGKGKAKGKGAPPPPPPGKGGKGKGKPAEPVAHPTLGMLEAGQKVMVADRGLCYVRRVAGSQVTVAQFCRNNKTAAVAMALVLPLPDPAAPIWEAHSFQRGWDAFPLADQAKLEAAFGGRGARQPEGAPPPLVMNYKGHRAAVDLEELSMRVNDASRPVRRRVQDEGGPAQPLSIVALEARASAGAKVRVKGRGLGTVIFVMENNAKVLLGLSFQKKRHQLANMV